MKIASWNVNSLKVRLPHVLDWLESANPDVLALQETKLLDENFPREAIEATGYHVSFAGQKTYNGVAIISKTPGSDIVTDIPNLDDPQRRIMAATIEGVRVLNLYVVNGAELDSEKFAYKLDWLNKVTKFIEVDQKNHDKYIILGDFNIAPEDRDLYNPEKPTERILCSATERDALQRILDLGFIDTFRLFEQPEKIYSWWDYRQLAFRRNRGFRIDLILASPAMEKACQRSVIDKEPRKLERPSDHAPVVAEFS